MTDGKPQGQRDWRWIALYAVAVGGMSVSISGQVQSIEHQLGGFLAVVFAVTNDVGAILALDIALGAAGGAVKKWAWVAILIAAGTGASLNAYHAMTPAKATPPGALPAAVPPLPTEFAILVGAEPVILVLVLSHLIGLVVAARRASADGQAPSTVSRSGGATVSAAVSAADDKTVRSAVSARTVSDKAVSETVSPTISGSQMSIGQDRQDTVTFTNTSSVRDRQSETVGSPERRALPPAATSSGRVPTPPARRALASVPAESEATPRQPWMTDELLAAVVTSMRAARDRGETYGRPTLMKDTGLNNYRAQTVQKYIAERPDLLRVSA